MFSYAFPTADEPGKECTSGESDELRNYGNEFERSGLPVGGEGISALAEAFNGEKLHGGCGPLQEELQLYEKLLGVSRSGSRKNDGIREKKRRKLREELKQDGFDLELQDMLDSILVRFKMPRTNLQCQPIGSSYVFLKWRFF